MTKNKRFICVLLVVVLLCGCLSFSASAFAELIALEGASAMLGASTGLGITASTGLNASTQVDSFVDWNRVTNTELGDNKVYYDSNTGALLYNAGEMTAYKNFYRDKFQNATLWEVPELNLPGVYPFGWHSDSANGFVEFLNERPDLAYSHIDSTSTSIWCRSELVPSTGLAVGDVITWTMSNGTGSNPRAYIGSASPSSPIAYLYEETNGTSRLVHQFNSTHQTYTLTAEDVDGDGLRFGYYVYLYANLYNPSRNVKDVSPIQVNNARMGTDIQITSGLFDADPIEISLEYSGEYGDDFHLMEIPEGGSVSFSYYDENDNNILEGVPPDMVSTALATAVLENRIARVESVIDNTPVVGDEEEDTDNWLQGILLRIAGTLDQISGKINGVAQSIVAGLIGVLTAIKDGVLELVSILEAAFNFTPPNWDDVFAPFIGWINGLQFPSIWHYVIAWVGSMSAGASFLWGIWNGLPYGLIIPVYATAVIVIIVSLFKRYVR